MATAFVCIMQLRKAASIIESGKPFDVGYFTFSRTNNTGGEFVDGHQVRSTGKINKKGQWVNLLFQDGNYRKVHLKLITNINGEMVV